MIAKCLGAAGLALALCRPAAGAETAAQAWLDNERKFKMRDKSPQHNETPYSSAETVVVSKMTGYHEIPVSPVASQPEGALVSFKGKVTGTDQDTCTVSGGGATVKVMTQAAAGAVDAALKGRDVAVKGCVWICNGEKRVTWAEIR